MKLPKIMKVPKHRSFSYNPRHYDAKKEDLERRVEQGKMKSGGDTEALKSRIRTDLRNSRNTDPQLRSKLVRKSNTRIFMIIVLLVVLSLIMINVYLPKFLQ